MLVIAKKFVGEIVKIKLIKNKPRHIEYLTESKSLKKVKSAGLRNRSYEAVNEVYICLDNEIKIKINATKESFDCSLIETKNIMKDKHKEYDILTFEIEKIPNIRTEYLYFFWPLQEDKTKACKNQAIFLFKQKDIKITKIKNEDFNCNLFGSNTSSQGNKKITKLKNDTLNKSTKKNDDTFRNYFSVYTANKEEKMIHKITIIQN